MTSPLRYQATMALYFTNSTTNDPTFSYQDAVPEFMINHMHVDTWTWYWQGCIVGNARNCNAACQDPSLAFGSPFTLANCMLLSAFRNISVYEDGSLYLPLYLPYTGYALDSSVPHEMNLTIRQIPEYSQAFAVSFAPKTANNVSRTVQKVIQDCFAEYCETSSACAQYTLPGTNCMRSFGTDQDSLCFPDICNFYSAPLNQDIGGIGVR